jgi:hypothetical protein
MLKRTLITGIIALFAAINIMAQDTTRVEHVLSTNPFFTAFGWINTVYEKPVSEKTSIVANVDFVISEFNEDFFYVGVGFGMRRYFTYKKKPVPRGFYIQPYLNAYLGEQSAFIPSVQLGYQWIWSSGFSLTLGLGPGAFISEGDIEQTPFGTAVIGYAW